MEIFEVRPFPHWLVRILFVLGLAGVSVSSIAGAEEPPELKDKLERIIKKSRVKPEELAFAAEWRFGSRRANLISMNADRPMILASVSKLLTGATILSELGPGFKFETHLKSTADVKGGVLKGDLFLVGGGDSGFVSESMWFLVNEFLRSEIKTIEGDIVVDESRFDGVRFDPSREDGRVDRAYDSPVGAMSFNWNAVNVFVRPGASGEAARVWLDPENSFVKLENRTVTKGGDGKRLVSAERRAGAGGDTIRVVGRIASNAQEQVIYKGISEPALWSGANLVSFLNQRGIRVTGKVKSGKAPSSARSLAKAESRPLSLLVTDMMKWSNNFVAEMLVKNLAAEKVGTPARLVDGTARVREHIVKWGIAPERFTFTNPSGLTRDNRMRADDFLRLLAKFEEDFAILPELLSSLPTAGVDGTLRSRMQNSALQGRVRAKTGMLRGVVSLVGYIGRRDGANINFVYLFNGRPDLGEDARALIDQLAAVMVDQ